MANEEPCLEKASEGAGSGAGCRAERGGDNVQASGRNGGRAQMLGCGETQGKHLRVGDQREQMGVLSPAA